jgi:hypothetical protein
MLLDAYAAGRVERPLAAVTGPFELVAVDRVTRSPDCLLVVSPPWPDGTALGRRTKATPEKGAFSQLLGDLESTAWEGIDVARRSNALA